MVMAILGLYKPPFKKSFVYMCCKSRDLYYNDCFYIVIAFCLGSSVIFIFILDTCVQFIKIVLVKCLNFEFTGWV